MGPHTGGSPESWWVIGVSVGKLNGGSPKSGWAHSSMGRRSQDGPTHDLRWFTNYYHPRDIIKFNEVYNPISSTRKTEVAYYNHSHPRGNQMWFTNHSDPRGNQMWFTIHSHPRGNQMWFTNHSHRRVNQMWFTNHSGRAQSTVSLVRVGPLTGGSSESGS